MKRLNKKGFTLIELLAVIIILGILMIIAIPSVTSYIQNSRKSAYVDTAVGYMDAVMKEVNSSKNLRFYSTDTLYMVAVGHDKKNSCVTVESGGQSPFSDTWKYAYVGVTYDGKGYSYYFMAEDGAGQGIGFIDKKTLTDDGTDYIYSTYGSTEAKTAKGTNSMTSTLANSLGKVYTVSAGHGLGNNLSYSEQENSLNSLSINGESNISTPIATAIVGSLKDHETTKTIKNIVFVVKNSESAICTFKEALGAGN